MNTLAVLAVPFAMLCGAAFLVVAGLWVSDEERKNDEAIRVLRDDHEPFPLVRRRGAD